MELIPQKLFPVTMLPIFAVIPTKLIPQTKKAAGNIFGGGGTFSRIWRCVAGESRCTPWKGPCSTCLSALKAGVALQAASWKVSGYKGVFVATCRLSRCSGPLRGVWHKSRAICCVKLRKTKGGNRTRLRECRAGSECVARYRGIGDWKRGHYGRF